ncbi:MAG: hypothetical protein ACOY3E_13400 [Pseudomonadota bacterium]
MELLIGAALALAVGIFATMSGFDKDRAFYPTVTIVVASYYVLYAVMAQPHAELLLELAAAAVFIIFAVAGFRQSLWFAVIALVAHGVFDIVRAPAMVNIIDNPGVPSWWPPFCLSYDVVAAIYLAWLLKTGRVRAGR